MGGVEGKVVAITGAGSGIGEATAELLAERGAKVVIADLDRQEEKAKDVVATTGGLFVACDVTDPEQVITAVDAAKELGPVRVLVNCAGIGWPQRTIGKDGQYSSAHDLGIFTKVIQINLIGTFNCIRLAATAMSQTEPLDEFGERGAIVNTASVAAYDGQIGQAAYSASKAGIVGMTLTVARDLAVSGIRVNTIAPGFIDTPMVAYRFSTPDGDIDEARRDEVFADRASGTVLKRIGQPIDIALAMLYLASGASSFMTGQIVRPNGGMVMP
ncbi:MAG: SDR family oxidoreductase [Pseudonocardia sediminis]